MCGRTAILKNVNLFGLQISMFWPVCRGDEHGQKFPWPCNGPLRSLDTFGSKINEKQTPLHVSLNNVLHLTNYRNSLVAVVCKTMKF